MKYLENIFYNLRIVNQLKVSFVNDVNLKYDDSLGLHYTYNPPLYHNLFENDTTKVHQIHLKNNAIYHNNQIIKPSELISLITPWIENNHTILSLYDLVSTYEHFLEMHAIINTSYKSVRETHAKFNFNKTLDKLNKEELTAIKLKIMMRHIWSYSIPHYQSIIEKENTFL